jgi:hypothetical protein
MLSYPFLQFPQKDCGIGVGIVDGDGNYQPHFTGAVLPRLVPGAETIL